MSVDGIDGIKQRLEEYQRRIRQALVMVANYWKPVLEAYAKENAPWTDRTGNARQGLQAIVDDLSQDTVKLYLAHGMEYGLWLEIRWAGRYAAIWPTIQAHLTQIRQMLQEVFS